MTPLVGERFEHCGGVAGDDSRPQPRAPGRTADRDLAVRRGHDALTGQRETLTAASARAPEATSLESTLSSSTVVR